MKHWQDFMIDQEQRATVVEQKHSAAIYRLPNGTCFVTDMSHPGDVYPEESGLTLEQARKVYDRK